MPEREGSVIPTSFWSSIPKICAEFEYGQPKKVLDIGIGWGKYGMLAREYSQALERLDGVEVHAPYIQAMQKAIYDKIYNIDILKDLETLPKDYDLVLMCDVIEHMEKEDGYRIIDYFENSKIIVSTPITFMYEPHPENTFEEHVSHWGFQDFETRYPSKDISEGPAVIAVIRPWS